MKTRYIYTRVFYFYNSCYCSLFTRLAPTHPTPSSNTNFSQRDTLFGLVALVALVDPNRVRRTVFLPRASWRDISSQRVFNERFCTSSVILGRVIFSRFWKFSWLLFSSAVQPLHLHIRQMTEECFKDVQLTEAGEEGGDGSQVVNRTKHSSRCGSKGYNNYCQRKLSFN